MKIFNKKVVSAIVLSVLLLSLGKITYAFPKMDICNYTNGDHSGDYYDGLCTIDGKKSETDIQMNSTNSNNSNNEDTNIEKKENLNSKLTPVKHYTGSSAFIGNINSKNKEEINKLKEIISSQNELIEKLKLENSKLIKNQNILLKNIKQKENIINNIIKYNSQNTHKNTNIKKNIKKVNNIEQTLKINNYKTASQREKNKETVIEKIKRINAEKAKKRK